MVRAFCDVHLSGRLFAVRGREGGSRESLLPLLNIICAGQTENDLAPFSGLTPSYVHNLSFVSDHFSSFDENFKFGYHY